jgi:hypothetical protein
MRSEPIPEIVEGLPNISGSEDTIATGSSQTGALHDGRHAM